MGREKEAYSPPVLVCGRENRRGVRCPRQGCSPSKERKLVGCGRGVGREKEAHSPPGSAVVEETDGEYGVPGRGTPRRKNETRAGCGGEWDAKKKLIPRPVQLLLGKPTGSMVSTKWVRPSEGYK